jgi:site-specific DNA recombinase
MTRSPTNSTRRKGAVRCAIYTRKSSEEGLEQEFNSLQAQREACEAFITSQRHEGWACLPKAYDDGGFSGATMVGRLCSGCSPTSQQDGSILSSSTRSTG